MKTSDKVALKAAFKAAEEDASDKTALIVSQKTTSGAAVCGFRANSWDQTLFLTLDYNSSLRLNHTLSWTATARFGAPTHLANQQQLASVHPKRGEGRGVVRGGRGEGRGDGRGRAGGRWVQGIGGRGGVVGNGGCWGCLGGGWRERGGL